MPAARRAAHGDAERVGQPALGRIRREADVEHLDVVFLGVVDDPLDSLQGIAQGAGAEVVEHLDVVDVGARRDAGGIGRRRRSSAPCRRRSRPRACRGRTRSCARLASLAIAASKAASSALPGRQRGRAAGRGGPVGGAGIAQVDVAPHARAPPPSANARCAFITPESSTAMPMPLPSSCAALLLRLPVRTLPVRAPVIASSVLAVRRVTRFGDTLATSRRWASATTSAEGTCTVSARKAGWTAWIAPPVRSTAVRNSVIAGSVELLTMIDLDVANPVQVAHPARLRLARLDQTRGEIACDLRLRRKHLRLGVRAVELRQPEKQGQRDDEPREDGSRPASVDRNDERWVRIHGVAAENTAAPLAWSVAARARVQLPLYREAPAGV